LLTKCCSTAGYESLTGKLVKLLERLKNREVSPDYTYYGIASPWLQVSYKFQQQYCSHSLTFSYHIGHPRT